MFRAEVVEETSGFTVKSRNERGFLISTFWMNKQVDAEDLAAQINAGAGAVEFNAAAIREAVRMEREAVVNWLRQGLGCLENAIANSIERGDHTKGGAE